VNARVAAVRTIAGFALRESLRRRVFLVVLVLSAAFLGLYALGAAQAFHDADELAIGNSFGVEPRVIVGATMLGLAMFGTLFLGAILAVFLTLGVVRGDADRGLLQPVVVRPVGRSLLLVARFLGAGTVCGAYVGALFAATVLITGVAGGWWPDRVIGPGLALAGAACVICALSLLGSVALGTTANGIAVFMVFGAGLVAGLLGQIGEALGSSTLNTVSGVATWALPFEALYQGALSSVTADTVGFTKLAIDLGPFGGAEDAGPLLWPWVLLYLAVVGLVAARGFARRDL